MGPAISSILKMSPKLKLRKVAEAGSLTTQETGVPNLKTSASSVSAPGPVPRSYRRGGVRHLTQCRGGGGYGQVFGGHTISVHGKKISWADKAKTGLGTTVGYWGGQRISTQNNVKCCGINIGGRKKSKKKNMESGKTIQARKGPIGNYSC